MSAGQVYDVRRVVEAYLDAQRPPYPHEDFRVFRQKRLAALEAAYGIQMAHSGVPPDIGALWMLFVSATRSLISLRGPRAGWLEDSLLNDTINRIDSPSLKLRDTEDSLRVHLEAARNSHRELLDSLFVALWGPIEAPLTSEDLARLGFDDSAEPKLSDYFDYM